MIKRCIFLLFMFVVGLVSASNLTSYTTVNLLHTDRFCYVSGDYVLLKAYCINDLNQPRYNEAVLYVDLVNSQGDFIKGEILQLSEGKVSGYLQIPDTVKTGYYNLRTYTYNSVNNGANAILATVQLYVTNRFGNNGVHFRDTLEYLVPPAPILEQDLNFAGWELKLDDTVYAKRSKVSAILNMGDDTSEEIAWLDLSVKPLSAKETQMAYRNQLDRQHKLTKTSGSMLQFQAVHGENESKGIIISGEAIHEVTGKPLQNYMVLLAFEDSILRLNYDITDKQGKFSFLLNDCFGDQRIYLSVYTHPGMEIYTQALLHMDTKYVTEKSSGIATRIKDGYEISADSLNVVKSIIAKAYGISMFEIPQGSRRSAISYEQLFLSGKVNHTVYMDNYVELPDFIQISREILPYVKLRKKEQGYMFSVNDGINSLVRHNPMIFVDGVPLTRNENIVTWGTKKIHKVLVQVEPRYFGDAAFENGLIFIHTRNMDFWENAEHDYNHRFLVQGFQKPVKFMFPDYSLPPADKIPDFRQILFWKPDITLKGANAVSIEFYTSDEVGDYEMVLRGLTQKKEAVYMRKFIHVK